MMNRSFKCLLLLSALVCVMVNCRKKEWDDYYGRPDTLEPPIYQVLSAKGNFKTLLACIDKAGYKNILSSAGYWTLFAPTDSAFAKYLQEKGLTGIDQMSETTAQQIVRFSLVYNAFNKQQLDDYQSAGGWVPDNAYRRRTAYYDLFDSVWKNSTGDGAIVSANRNGGYSASDNNNKYITYFTAPYFSLKSLSAADYNYFYPNSVYSGLNIMDARITQTDIAAENGYIQVVDKVLVAQPSIEKYLASKPEYSIFKGLLDRYMVLYLENADATDKYRVLKGGSGKAQIKLYNPALAFSPNNENYLKMDDNDGQSGSWSLFAPKNEVLLPYLKSTILEHYNNDTANLSKINPQIITDLINAHMYQAAVWPTQFPITNNFLGEEARFDPAADIADKKVLSNGFFYGTSKVQASNLFSTVFSRPYLDPKYSLMTRLLGTELKALISNPKVRYTLIMLPDDVLYSLGFSYSTQVSNYVCSNPATLGAGTPGVTLARILNMCIIPKYRDELTSVSGTGIAETYGGEMIRYDNNKVYAAGNIDSSKYVNITGTKVMENGTVLYTDGILYFSALSVGQRLENLSPDVSSPYYNFFQYLKNSTLYTASTKAISGMPLGFVGSLLIPDNDAIVAAVNAGLLPGTAGVPNFAPTASVDKEKVAAFLQYHIIKRAVINNGVNNLGDAETLYRSLLTDKVGFVKVTDPGAGNALTFTDATGRVVQLNTDKSYVLADRVVIHSLKSYLQY